MIKSYKSWKSPSLGEKAEMLIYGKDGTLAILFPSACGSYHEWEKNGAFEVLDEQIENFQPVFLHGCLCLGKFSESTNRTSCQNEKVQSIPGIYC